MTDSGSWYGLLFFGLLVFHLLAAAARSSLTNLNMARLLTMREEIGERVETVASFSTASRRHLAGLYTLQVVLRLVLVAVLFLWLFVDGILRLEQPWLGLLALVLTGLILAWLEWVVASYVAARAEDVAILLAGFIRVTGWLMAPFVFLPLLFTRKMGADADVAFRVTEEELKTMVDAGEQEGLIEQEERKMIYSIFDLGETLAREIMVPRIDLLALEVHTPLDRAVDALLGSGYSRVPVYEETVDNVLGLLYAKDLLRAWRSGEQDMYLGSLLRPAYFIPEAKKVDELLTEMQSQRIHMAIVVDEYGGVAGLVTLEDIVEEIVGEIRDEFDQTEEAFFQQIGPDEYLCSGRMDLDDFNELMGTNLPDEDADTLGGFIYSRIGRVPIGGEKVVVDDLELIVEQLSKRQIRSVRARRVHSQAGEEMEEDHVNP